MESGSMIHSEKFVPRKPTYFTNSYSAKIYFFKAYAIFVQPTSSTFVVVPELHLPWWSQWRAPWESSLGSPEASAPGQGESAQSRAAGVTTAAPWPTD